MNTMHTPKLLLLLFLMNTTLMIALPVQAAEEAQVQEGNQGAVTMPSAIRAGMLALAAAIVMGAAAFATAKVQSAVGAGATGALAEKPELFGLMLLLYAIPETMVLLGFVLAFLIMRM